jgi:spore maturation protein CgeB
MKLLQLGSAYPLYLNNIYHENPGMETKSYHEQKKIIEDDSFGVLSNPWAYSMKPLGYEVDQIIANCMPLQKAWVTENGVKINVNQNWKLDIARTQVLTLKPDILFAYDYSLFNYQWLHELKQCCGSIKVVLGWCSSIIQDESVFKAYDAVLTSDKGLAQRFKSNGHKSEQIKAAFDEQILKKISLGSPPNIDISFVGSLMKGHGFHGERIDTLKSMRQELDIQVYTNDYKNLSEEIILGKNIHNGIFGVKMYQLLHDSKVTFNCQIDIAGSFSGNMRMFEATGVGPCLMTDWKEDLAEYFEPDTEVVVYRTKEECIEKAKWLLKHPQECEEIAKAGQRKTLSTHTYNLRANQLDMIIKNLLIHFT